jgi:hypothetical protein
LQRFICFAKETKPKKRMSKIFRGGGGCNTLLTCKGTFPKMKLALVIKDSQLVFRVMALKK